MAQHDYDIANQSGSSFRADLNNALDAIVSNNSGSSEPSTTFAYEWWIDTSNNLLKLRNSANNAWITIPISITADNSTPGALTVNGNLTTTGQVDINGQELILDADADTSITSDTDDQIDFKIGGTDVATLTNSHLVLKGTTPKITIGDGGAEDTALIYDGNAQDYYLGLDDTDDIFKIGNGSTIGTNRVIAITPTGDVAFGSDVGDVTSDGVSSRTYVSILGAGNRGVLNLGTTAQAGADGGKLSFVNGANVTGEISCDPDSGSATNGNLAFNTTNAQRMKILSGGGFLVGKSADNQATAGFQITGSNLHNVTSTNSGTGSSTFMVHDGSGLNFYVNFTGQVFYRVGLSNLSDQRLKENIIDLDKGLDDILKIKPRRFDWIEGEGEKNQTGFIAQEIEDAGLEELVSHYKGASLDDAKGVNQVGLIPILVKAVQELSEKVKKLER